MTTRLKNRVGKVKGKDASYAKRRVKVARGATGYIATGNVRADLDGYSFDDSRPRRRRHVLTLRCRSTSALDCQMQLLIYLYNRLHCAPRPLERDPKTCSLKVEMPTSPARYSIVSWEFLVKSTGRSRRADIDLVARFTRDTDTAIGTGTARLVVMDALEDQLVSAIRLLHSKDISFPVTAECISFLVAADESTPPRLFLGYNKRAAWASDMQRDWERDQEQDQGKRDFFGQGDPFSRGLAWQDGELAQARALFAMTKALLAVCSSPAAAAAAAAPAPTTTTLDPDAQSLIALYFLAAQSTEEHLYYCAEAAITTGARMSLSVELAVALAQRFTAWHRTKGALDIIKAFAGGADLELPPADLLAGLEEYAYGDGHGKKGGCCPDDGSDLEEQATRVTALDAGQEEMRKEDGVIRRQHTMEQLAEAAYQYYCCLLSRRWAEGRSDLATDPASTAYEAYGSPVQRITVQKQQQEGADKGEGVCTSNSKNIEGIEVAISRTDLVRLICCRAEVAILQGIRDTRAWRALSMVLYCVFLPERPTEFWLDRSCAYYLDRARARRSM